MTGYAGGSLEAATKEQRLILNHEANDPKYTPDERAAVQREIARLPKEPEEKQNTFSIKDAYGDKPITPKPMSEGRKMASSLYSGAQDVASLGDMFLNLGTNIPAVMGMMNRYGQGVATGESHKVTSEAARQVFDRINSHAPNLLQNLLSLVPNPNPSQPNGNESHVAKAMDVFTNLTDQEARELSYKTDPVINETDWKNLRDVAMIALGAKGLEVTGEGLAKSAIKAPEKEAPTAEPKEPKLEDEIPTPEKASQPASSKQLKALQSQVRQKYTDDAQYAQVFNERAKAQAMVQNGLNGLTKAVEDRAAAPREETTPIILTPEGKIDTSVVGQRSLDSGLKKIAAKKPFLMTPEEKIAVAGAQRAAASPMILTGKQAGKIKPEVLGGIAMAGLGMAVGAKLDPNNPIEGAVAGVLGAAFLRSGAIGKMKETAEKISAPDTRIRINDLTERLSHHIAQGARTSWQASGRMIDLVPDKARREAITRAIDAGTTGELKGKEAELADYQHQTMEAALEMGRKYGVLDAAVDDYITHFWQRNGKSEEALKQLARAKYQQGMSPATRFSKARIYTSLEEGKAAGLKPLTEDVAVITDMYLNSVYRAIANKRFLDNLHHAKAPGGIPLVLKAAKAPPIYETIDHPLLRNYRVHPDIVPSLKFLFDSTDPSKTMTALSAVNTAIKRNAVSISLFHAKSLLDAAIGASNHPGLAVKVLAQAAAPKVFGENRYLKMLREGGAGDLPDTAQRDGVVFSFSRHEPSVEDVTGSYYKGMKWLQNSLDDLVPGLGLPVKEVTAVNHMLDDFMWGRLHAAFKLEIYAAKKEALMRNTAKAGKGLTDEQAGRIAASYTNDVFGGLNWQRIAESASTKWGRDIALELLSPKGRRMTQLALFAPDWTLSTTRALLQARPRRIGLKASIEGTRDLFSAKTLQDLHRQQFIRSALWYVTVGDGINYAMTGHHIRENKNPLRVDLGDGLSMQLSKHFTEPLEWFREPGQQALNKLGYLPSEALDQMQGTQWLSSSGHAKRMDTSPLGRVKHAARAALPFSMNQFVESNGGGGARSAISGTLGVPIYGQTPSEKRQARLDAALKKYHERYGQ